jgi:hypothetical protein
MMRYEVFQHFTRDVWRLQRDVTCHGHSWPWVRVLRTESSICQPVPEIGEPRSYRGVARPPMSFQARSTTLERELGASKSSEDHFIANLGLPHPASSPLEVSTSSGVYISRSVMALSHAIAAHRVPQGVDLCVRRFEGTSPFKRLPKRRAN